VPRKPRSALGPGVYHVLNRGLNRIRIFDAEGDASNKQQPIAKSQ
jgi:hypothetical protein